MTKELELPQPLTEILEVSKTPIVEMQLSKREKPLPLTDSKIGGVGFYPINESYPYTEEGTPLSLIIQINFEQLAKQIDISNLPQPLPDSGLLQIYIDPTCDLCGCDMDDYTQNDGYQVRYWEDLDAPVNLEALNKAQNSLQKIDEGDILSPIQGEDELAINFTLTTQSCGGDCIEFGKFLSSINPELEYPSLYEFLENSNLENSDNIYDVYNELATNDGHHIFGYPYFTQADPREYNDDLKNHILLFQIDSDHKMDILWGDCGVANFFITPEALAEKDFDQLLYSWDCT